uniref:Uncharacterized protein n=1 Tax=Utricularia reniformis TaxID=192314 RepID=A0A1Y0B3X4_9LAMI|nr:hypothetical protein AEK19_MT1935 [Utricularia reniformis]ART32100.1 hypothetical protein AEK19_MT1935 [Utricularia reniformis]
MCSLYEASRNRSVSSPRFLSSNSSTGRRPRGQRHIQHHPPTPERSLFVCSWLLRIQLLAYLNRIFISILGFLRVGLLLLFQDTIRGRNLIIVVMRGILELLIHSYPPPCILEA